MKVKVINKNTNQQFDCEEIEINGFKYYIIDTAIKYKYGISKLNEVVEIKTGDDDTLYKGIICTNNPNIDIHKVVDEVELLANLEEAKEYVDVDPFDPYGYSGTDFNLGYQKGYNKSQESHPFSEEDMIEFAEFMFSVCKEYQRGGTYVVTKPLDDSKTYTVKELLQLWKEQKIKTVYYE